MIIVLYLQQHIQSKDEESCVKQAFLISFDLHCNGKNSFHSHLMNVSEYFKLPDFNPDLLDIAMVKSYVSSMKQEYISYWQNTLQHSQKLQFYRSFKSNHNTSSYLDLTGGAAVGRALVKLRISNHTLRDRAIIIRKGGPKMSFTKGKIRLVPPPAASILALTLPHVLSKLWCAPPAPYSNPYFYSTYCNALYIHFTLYWCSLSGFFSSIE